MIGAGAAWLLGNVSVHGLTTLPSVGQCGLGVAVALVLSAIGRTWLPLWWVAAFVWTSQVAADRLTARSALTEDGRDWQVEGWVDTVPVRSPERTILSLRVAAGSVAFADARIRLSWYDAPLELVPGAALALTVRLRYPRGHANPDGFDYERWLFAEGYAATGYVKRSHAPPVPDRHWAARLLRLRWQLAERIRERIVDPQAAALVTALALGERSTVDEQLWSVFRRTGTSHLIAISGLHISLVSGLCFAFLIRLLRRAGPALAGRDLEIALAAALCVAWGYAALAGFALPTRRAALMCTLAAVVAAARRRVGALNGIAVATIVVLALDPLATLSASFWLSFAAVTVLLLSLLPQGSGAAASNGVAARIGNAIVLQCRLSLALVPLGAAFFHGISLVAVPINLIAIPWFCVVLIPLTLAAVSICAIAPSLTVLIDLAGRASALTVAALVELAALPAALIETSSPDRLAIAIAVAAVCIALPWHPSSARSIAWLGLLPLFLPRVEAVPTGQLHVTMLDVGHGLAMILQTRTHRLVYDAGPLFRSGFDAGVEVLVPALEQRRAELDLVIISHADTDHSGGAHALLSAYPRARLLRGPDVELAHGTVCRAGQRWRWDHVDFEILHPAPGFAARGNESSCVLLARTATHAILIAGDIERRGEEALGAYGALRADVVVVPHHGSATSSSPRFVAQTGSRLALVSAGFGNQWGFPVASVRRRWRAAGTELLVTGDVGAIGVRLGGAELEVQLERERHRRYWHAN